MIYCENIFSIIYGKNTIVDVEKQRPMYEILDVNKTTKLWTSLIQVLEIHHVQENKNRDKKPYKRFVLIDKKGTKVSAVAYENSDIRKFTLLLHPFKRYYLSNASLQTARSFFKVSSYEYTWVLNCYALVEDVPDTELMPLPCTFNLTSFSDFSKFADSENLIDVMGVVIGILPPNKLSETSSHREIIIINEESIPVILTLWNAFGEQQGQAIANDLKNGPVIIARNVKVSTFHSLSLATKVSSYIYINPPVAQLQILKDWRNNNKEEVEQIIHYESYKNPDVLLPPPKKEDVLTVENAITFLKKQNTTWVVGRANAVEDRQRFSYTACMNCLKSLNAAVEWIVTCKSCNHSAGVSIRSRIGITISNTKASLRTTLYTPEVERFTGLKPEDIRTAEEVGLNVITDLKKKLKNKKVVCFLKKIDFSKDNTKESRFTVLKGYSYEKIFSKNEESTDSDIDYQLQQSDSPGSSTDLPSNLIAFPTPIGPPQSPPPQLLQGTSDQLFFTPTTGNILSEIQASLPTSSHATVGAKRILSFGEAGSIPGKTTSSHADDEDKDDTLQSLTSPVKKNKEKMN